MPENLHQQPGRIAARPGACLQRLLAGLDARIQSLHIVDFPSDFPIQVHQEADRSSWLARKLLQKGPEKWICRLGHEIRLKILSQFGIIGEWVSFSAWFQKEIERIEWHQIGDQIHLNRKLVGFIQKENACEMVVVGVELPVENVRTGSNSERVVKDRRSTMRGGTQSYELRTNRDRLVVAVLCPVIQCNLDAH